MPIPNINLQKAVALLKSGEVICFATDTVYALACDATNDKAVSKLYNLKKRDKNKPIAVLVKSLNTAKKFLTITKIEEKITKKFMPGPLTIVAKKKPISTSDLKLSKLLNNNSANIGFRIPDDDFSMQILKKFNGIIAATSANISKQNPAINYSEAKQYFDKKIDLIIDGGTCKNKVASTVIAVEKNQLRILREGLITKKQLEDELN